MKNDLRRKLTKDIVGHIRDAKMEAGSRLTERSLCDAFNVSRTPVRAALRALAEAGILHHVGNRGYFTSVAAADIQTDGLMESDEDSLYLRVTRARFEGGLESEFTEADLGRRFEVPRRTLTRVLQRLLRERLIEKRPGRGWRFAEILDTQQAHDESYRFRLCIEPASLLEPTFRVDERRLSQCRNDTKRFWRATLSRFHRSHFFRSTLIFTRCLQIFPEIDFFREAMRQQNNLRRVISYQWVYGPERVLDTCHEHLAIVDAVLSGDTMWAANLLRKHLTEASA